MPRNITSPSVSPSRGDRLHRCRIEHVELLEHRIAHALARLLCGLLVSREAVPVAVPVVDDGRPVGLGQPVDVGDVEAGGLHRREHRLGRRRRRGHELDDVRQRLLLLRRGVEQRRHHDRRAAQMGDLVVGDRVEDRRRAHRPQADMRAGDDRQRPRKAPAVAVEHRQRPQIDRVLLHAAGNHVADREQIGAAMMVDDALRIAGRARSVVERDSIPLVVRHPPGEIGVAGVQEILVFQIAEAFAGAGKFRVVIVDDQRLCLGASERVLHHLGKFAVDDQHLGLGMVEREGEDARRRAAC